MEYLIRLTLTQTQATVLQKATELYSHLGRGQLDKLLQFRHSYVWLDDKGRELHCDPDTVKAITLAQKQAMFGFKLGASYEIVSQGVPENFRVAHDLHQVLQAANDPKGRRVVSVCVTQPMPFVEIIDKPQA